MSYLKHCFAALLTLVLTAPFAAVADDASLEI